MTPPTTATTYDELRVEIHPDAAALGRAAAARAADRLRGAIRDRGAATAILATGNSQLSFFEALRAEAEVEWSRVRLFHMDEYLGIDAQHPASFRRFLRRELVEPLGVGAFHGMEADPDDPERSIASYAALLERHPPDLCCMGIGENGHLAFNDPPFADFEDPAVARVVELDRVSRLQQVGEGHFPDLGAVPTHAITLTIPTLLRAEEVLVIVPEARKAEAVQRALEGPITPDCPASVLRRAAHATLLLDAASASKLARDPRRS